MDVFSFLKMNYLIGSKVVSYCVWLYIPVIIGCQGDNECSLNGIVISTCVT